MATDELLDIYDETMRPLGTATRARAHAEGLWHRTVHIWLASPLYGGSLIYQIRSAAAADNQGLLDATAAGHLRAGEAMRDAFREAEEEIGFPIAWEDARLLGERREVRDYPDGTRNREVQSVYLAVHDPASGRFDPRDGEAAGLVWIVNDAGIALACGRAAPIECPALIVENGALAERALPVSMSSLVPRTGHYYVAVHSAARRLLASQARSRT